MIEPKNIYGLIGFPIKHSLSPIIHNKAFEYFDLNAKYLLFPVKTNNLISAINGIRALSIKGVNVTIPHKVSVMDLLDDISEEAKIIGAVNTIVNIKEKLVGYNTDGLGFFRSLEENNVNPKDYRVIILGAGGAAKAISVTMAMKGVNEIHILNRTKEKAEQIIKNLNNIKTGNFTYSLLEESIFKELIKRKGKKIIINTTSIGMDSECDLPINNIHNVSNEDIVIDIVYSPSYTNFLKIANNAGAKIILGKEMLLYQAFESFKIWTGLIPPTSILKKVLDNNLN